MRADLVFFDILVFLRFMIFLLGFAAIMSVLLQVEFVGGPMCWNTRLFTATAGTIFIFFFSFFFCLKFSFDSEILSLFLIWSLKFKGFILVSVIII